MTLDDWICTKMKRVGFDSTYEALSKMTGSQVTISANPIDVELTTALVSTSNKSEFIALAKSIVEEQADEHIDEYLSDETYLLLISKAKLALTNKLLQTNSQLYRKWLDVLERRDSEHWTVKRNVNAQVNGNGQQPISISFEVIG